MKKFLTYAMVMVMSIAMVAIECDARGGRGGGFSSSRSSSFSRSSSTRSSPSRSLWGSKSSKSSSSTSRKSVPSKTDTKATKTFKKNGKTMSRKEAVSDFKSKAKSDPKVQAQLAKSHPTKYAKEPATRPSHIPQSYQGNTVIYQNGGYGYMNGGSFSPLMTYMLLDTMSDAAMMSAMNRSGYQTHTVHHSGGSGIAVLVFVVVLMIGCVVIFVMITKSP